MYAIIVILLDFLLLSIRKDLPYRKKKSEHFGLSINVAWNNNKSSPPNLFQILHVYYRGLNLLYLQHY